MPRNVRLWAIIVAACPAVPLTAQARVTDALPDTRLHWEMVAVPGGEVTVPGADGPVHVAVAPFLIGATEVPWDLYDVFYLKLDIPRADRAGVDSKLRPSSPYGAPDRGFGHRGWPAISLTHDAATRFAAWLSERTGHRYAVATDAQWQRAADVAHDPGDGGMMNVTRAWTAANADGTTHAIGSLPPDQLGLVDLLGNAGEWVTGVDGTPWLRGGTFLDSPDSISTTTRARQQPSWNQTDPQSPKSRWWLSDGSFVGFRLVRMP